MCIAGYGNTNCATQCGGVGASATYGAGERPLNTSCVACASTTLPVNISGTEENYTASASSKPGASDFSDCLSTWASYGANWYLDSADAAANTVAPAASLSACLDQCQANSQCLFATYLNATAQCRIRVQVKGQFVSG